MECRPCQTAGDVTPSLTMSAVSSIVVTHALRVVRSSLPSWRARTIRTARRLSIFGNVQSGLRSQTFPLWGGVLFPRTAFNSFRSSSS